MSAKNDLGIAARAPRKAESLPLDNDKKTEALDPFLPLPITVVYQDSATLAPAQALCGRLAQRFGPAAIRCTEWPFAALENREGARQVLAAARRSHILMLALRASDPLPDVVKFWLESWLSRGASEETALVALFAGPEKETGQESPADRYLGAAAREAGLEYFRHFVALGRPTETGPREKLAERAQTITPTLEGILTESHPPAFARWGLNE